MTESQWPGTDTIMRRVWACAIAGWVIALVVLRPNTGDEIILAFASGILAAGAYGAVLVPMMYDGDTIRDREGRFGDPGDWVWLPREELERWEEEKKATRR